MIFNPFRALQNLLSVFLIPLIWLPAPILLVLYSLLGVFAMFVIGRILKWVWDLLPIA